MRKSNPKKLVMQSFFQVLVDPSSGQTIQQPAAAVVPGSSSNSVQSVGSGFAIVGWEPSCMINDKDLLNNDK